MTAYFAYGANLDRTGMARRCPQSRPLGPARLDDHAFLIMEAGYATVASVAGRVVYGALWDLAEADVPALDAFEEVEAGLYDKIVLPVRVGEKRVDALIYRAASTTRGLPGRDYMTLVLAAAADWDMPADYLAELRAWLPA